MRRITTIEINKYLGAEAIGEFTRDYLKYEILIDLDEEPFGLPENINEKIDVINKIDEIINIVLFYRGDKEIRINSILNNAKGEYIEDNSLNEFKKSLLVLEIVQKRMRYHLMEEFV